MVRHVASIAEIVEDVDAAVRFYRDVLGFEVKRDAGAPYALVHVPGILHFGIWERTAAAESVYGDPAQAHRVPLGFSVGFEVDAVRAAVERLQAGGANVLHPPRQEPWGQTTARLLSPGGAVLEVAETPWARTVVSDVAAAGESA